MDYDELASQLKDRVSRLAEDEQWWIGVAGNPGSGKSTLASALKEKLGDLLTIIPMDGYHFYRRELDQMDDPVEAQARRGAPFTFDAERFVSDLIRARNKQEGSFPGFDHGIGDPVEDAILLKKNSRLVLVEGNYLLLEAEPWSQLKSTVFDETWFLDISIEECCRRVFNRHLQTGKTPKQARIRVETNDKLNAALITASSPQRADRILQISNFKVE